jgi:hypothetical protein
MKRITSLREGTSRAGRSDSRSGLALAEQVEAAFAVDDELLALGVEITETEYAMLIGVCRHGARWQRARSLLERMAAELTRLKVSVRPCASLSFCQSVGLLPERMARSALASRCLSVSQSLCPLTLERLAAETARLNV